MTDGTDILVKWPTRGRPALFRQTFARWHNDRVRFVVSIDRDDPTCNEPGLLGWLAGLANVRVAVGASASKVDAFNRDLGGESFDLLILGSDDMVPVVADYDQRIAAIFRARFPDLDGVLHLPDGRRSDDLVTLSIMGGPYYRRFGYVYRPDYVSLWADNEFGEVARRLGRIHYEPTVLIRHEWVGASGRYDAMLAHTESFFHRDRATFLRRRAAGFPTTTH